MSADISGTVAERRLRAQGKVVRKHAAGNIFENHEIIVENRMGGTGMRSWNFEETVFRMHRSNNSFSTRTESSGHRE